MKVTWYVEDGYQSGKRPHHVTVPDEEVAKCKSKEELDELIEGYVRSAFEAKVTFSWEGGFLSVPLQG